MTPEQQVALGALVFAAAAIQGVIGFAFGLVVMSVLPRWLPLGESVALTASLGVFVSGVLFLRYRREVVWPEVLPMLAGAVAGLPVGVLALKHLDPGPFVRGLGGVILAYVLFAAWYRPPPGEAGEPLVRRAWGLPAGVLGGAFGGAFATGGPPVIAYANARHLAPRAFRAVLQGFFFTATAAHLALLAGNGILTGAVAGRAAVYLPLVPLGTWLGGRFGDRLHPSVFRRIVLAALFVLGADYLLRGR